MAVISALAPLAAIGSTVATFAGIQHQQAATAQAAATQQRIESFNQMIAVENAATERQNAQFQQQLALQQAGQSQALAEQQHRFAESQLAWDKYDSRVEQAVFDANISRLESQAKANNSRTRNEIRREREKGERIKALQRARFAKSGVTSEGTPLEVLAETAGLVELGIQDLAYEGELESRNLRNQADDLRFKKSIAATAAGASQGRSSAIADLNLAVSRNRNALEGAAAHTRYGMQTRAADLAELSAINAPSRVPSILAQGRASSISGYGNLFANVSSFTSNGAFKFQHA